MIRSSCNTDFQFPLKLVQPYLDDQETRAEAIEDLTFMRLYIYKAMRALNNDEEVIEYCTEEFFNQLKNPKYEDRNIYGKDSLNKERFMDLVHYYRGLQYL